MGKFAALVFLLSVCTVAVAQEDKKKPQEGGKEVWVPPLTKEEKDFLNGVDDIGRCVTASMRRDMIVNLSNRTRNIRKDSVRNELIRYAFDKVSERLRTEVDYTVRAVCPEAITQIAFADVSGEIGRLAFAELLNALKTDKKNVVRAACAGYLAELGEKKEVSPALIEALKNDRWSIVRAACADAISKLAVTDAIPALREALANDRYSTVRKAAAIALTNFKDKDASKLFIKGLKDPFSSVRIACCNALETMPARDALLPLSELTKDAKERVRDATVRALGKLKEPGAVKVLEEVISRDESEYVRESVINALLEIGTKEAIEVIALKGLTDSEFQCRVTAISALCVLKDDRGIPALLESLNKEQVVSHRISYIELAEKLQIKDQRVLKTLQDLSQNDSSEDVKRKAKEALEKLRK
jgi:HEAT repeat protein